MPIEQIFNTPITRRGLLKVGAALGGGAALAAGARTTEAQLAAPELTAAMTDKLKTAAEQLFSIDDIALRISDAYQGEDGLWYIGYQGAVIQDHPILGTVLWNSMDELHNRDLDPILEALYQVPPQQSFTDTTTNTDEIFRIRADQLRLDKDIVDWAQQKRQSFEIGVPTSRQIPYGPFDAVRFQRYIAQKWADGRIERMLAGDIVKNVGRTVRTEAGDKTIPGKKIIPDIALLKEPEERLPQGGTTPTETQPQPGLILETLQTGKGKQTEWVIQKSPDSPVTPVVQRPDALNHVADTYLPRTGLKRVEIKFLSLFEGFKYNGLDFRVISISLTEGKDSGYGPQARIKYTSVQSGDILAIYYSMREDNSLELIKSNADFLDKANRSLSSHTGSLIAEAGGYNTGLAGRLAPEASALETKDLPSAIALVTS